ncbi:hypothetical protein EVAR_25549_1 [Eumeta japonica]|uniref:Uncharacterized protein n=1 Tax=Eumeta variegata TaxID=151549 RepID=A0A4C1Z2U8_EUMVA|nr:hypothetical protein EVAR_25549_1 [Eumeta japonica]
MESDSENGRVVEKGEGIGFKFKSELVLHRVMLGAEGHTVLGTRLTHDGRTSRSAVAAALNHRALTQAVDYCGRIFTAINNACDIDRLK